MARFISSPVFVLYLVYQNPRIRVLKVVIFSKMTINCLKKNDLNEKSTHFLDVCEPLYVSKHVPEQKPDFP